MRPRPSVLSLIGNTPLVPLYFPEEEITIYGKCEFLNPSGSIKDRFALAAIEDAEQRGLLNRDSVILECTSGNTGISLAMVGAAKGYRVKILMSDSASLERRRLIRQFGADLELFQASGGYATGIELCRKLAARDRRHYVPRQFENPLNAHDHEQHTGREILTQMNGLVDAFVSGYGTGGTITGCGRALRLANPGVKVVVMEPSEAAMLAGEMPCCHLIEGVAGGYVPPLLASARIDSEVKISSAEALGMARRLAGEFGLLVGTSSGANTAGALRVARDLGAGSRVVTVLCDRAERYFSTRLFQEGHPEAAAGAS
ncbi:MAG: PLP-dependent cysteine synthase family protein [Opitutaceae bacterium]